MVAATSRHEASCNPAPQIHTHCIVANMTHGQDNQWRSVEPTMPAVGEMANRCVLSQRDCAGGDEIRL